MEGEGTDSDDGVQGEDKPSVLWEKCIQQRILVDLSEDESLHLSDLESSLDLRLSQGESAASEASIHLSGSAELSALDVTSSESSITSSESERMFETKSSIQHVSAQRPNTTQNESHLHSEDLGLNTSDEDQDDLPYDGNHEGPFFKQTPDSEGNSSSDGRETVRASPDAPGLLECNTRDRDVNVESFVFVENEPEKPVTLSPEDANTEQENIFDASKPRDVASSCPHPADINQMLLQHFSQEELLRSGRLIEAETLPDVSLLESVDDTVISWAPTHNSTKIKSDDSGSRSCHFEFNQSFCSGWMDEKSNTASRTSSLEKEAAENIDNVPFAVTDDIPSSPEGRGHTSAVDAAKQDDQVQRAQLVRTRSFNEMKYGQGQVHYPLPDFSKVAPKVKIPKAPSGPARPALRSASSMHRAQSSPEMLEVISRVLEDSIQPSEKPFVFNGEVKVPPALVHHLQAEYDKLFTRNSETENLLDQMRLGTNAPPSSDQTVYNEDHQGNPLAAEGRHLGSTGPHLPPTETSGEKGEPAPHSNVKEGNTVSSNKPEAGSSDGERMTAELRGIINKFTQEVEEFRLSVSSMSLSTAEQQIMLRSIMEAQDQMEREYISKKEDHRALEMLNYMGLCRNTGTFDPDRLVEGDIFRIGMHIEDIKEMIDKNVCEQISPPHSSSTPAPVKEKLDVKPSPLCLFTPSPPPSLHEGQSAGFSTVGYKTETWRHQEVVEVSEVHGGDGLQESGELMTPDSLLKTTAHRCFSRRSQSSPEGLSIHTDEAEEERSSIPSEAKDHSNILDVLSGTRSSSRRRQRKPNRCSSPESVLNPVGESDLGDCVSLALGVSSSSDAPRDPETCSLLEPPLNISSVSQRIVSPETDSGFGSSYLNKSASGPFQPNLPTESVRSQNDALSSSDSEGSNLQTAIHSAGLTNQLWASTHHSVQSKSCGQEVAVQRWVESTTKEPSVRPQEQTESERTTPALHHHASEPALYTAMDAEDSPLYSCTCNSEAILALQSEVSRLKKDLEEGLVQLPHLAQKMDCLTSKYRQDQQKHRSKTRTRSHQRSACNSVWKRSNSRQNASKLSSSQARIEDWISSDLEPSKSKGTDGDDFTDSEIMLQFHKSPVGNRTTAAFQYEPCVAMGSNEDQSHSRSDGNGSVKTSDLISSILKGGDEEAYHVKQRPHTAIMESFYSREKWALFSPPSLEKPLLQVGYASSSSLPASFKVREPPLHSTSHRRKRSTQSDTALLPSNVFFQRTAPPALWPSRTFSRTGRRRGTKEDEMSRALDQAIEMACSMKRTTERMAKRLSADLVKAELHRKEHSMQPLGGRKHHTL